MSRPLRKRIRSPALRAAFSAGLPKRSGNKRGFSWWIPADGVVVPAQPGPGTPPGQGLHCSWSIWVGWSCSPGTVTPVPGLHWNRGCDFRQSAEHRHCSASQTGSAWSRRGLCQRHWSFNPENPITEPWKSPFCYFLALNILSFGPEVNNCL